MNEQNRDDDKHQTNSEPQQTDTQPDGSPKVSPKLDSDTASSAEQSTTYEIQPAFRRNWHEPLGIPITDWLIAFFTAVLVASSILYTVYARRQWKVMSDQIPELRKSADAARSAADTGARALADSRQQFRAPQRPIMYISNLEKGDVPNFIPNSNNPLGQIAWTVHFTNYGKTPPQTMSSATYMKLGDGPFVLSYGTKGALPEEPIPPGKIDFGTIYSRPDITRGQFVGYMDDNAAIAIRIVFEYTDVYQEKYETSVCLFHYRNGATGYCKLTYIK